VAQIEGMPVVSVDRGVGVEKTPQMPESGIDHPPAYGRPKVVIVGGGFGGIEAAKALRYAPADIILIDKKNHHCFQPLLYQVATASLSAADIAWPIRSILSDQDNVEVVMDEVVGVRLDDRLIVSKSGRAYAYNYLVLACGVTHSYFAHPEWEEYAPGLKSIEDALAIRSRILTAFEQAESVLDSEERDAALTFVVVGGGPTGVEMAGALADVAASIIASDFKNIRERRARIVLVEAGPRILGNFPDELSNYAHSALEQVGVEVRTGVAVIDCTREQVVLGNGDRIPTRSVVWAAGVRASAAAQWLGVTPDRAGRVPVGEQLQVVGLPGVYAIGDTAAFLQGGRPLPGLAPAAKQMGQFVGKLIQARITRTAAEAAFCYRHEGDLATIRRSAAIVSRGRLRLTGFPAWAFWGIAHVYFLIERRSRLAVTLSWLFEYVTRRRGARLIDA
jgi:NADH:ubiquinone reductase (H+-translocating)